MISTPSCVKKAAQAAASYLLNASSNFIITASICWRTSGSTVFCSWARAGTAKPIANPVRASTERIFIVSFPSLDWSSPVMSLPSSPSVAGLYSTSASEPSKNRPREHSFCPIALERYRIAGLFLKNQIPFPVAPHLVTSRSYDMRGMLIRFVDMVAEVQILEHICKMFLNGLPTVNRPFVCHENPVVCEECRDRVGIVLVDCLVILFYFRVKLLA